jgi:hypothetical protein
VTKTFTSFSCAISSPPSGGGTTTFRVRINGASTSTACAFSGGGPSTVSGTYTVSAGETIDVLVTNSASTSTRAVGWGLGG